MLLCLSLRGARAARAAQCEADRTSRCGRTGGTYSCKRSWCGSSPCWWMTSWRLMAVRTVSGGLESIAFNIPWRVARLAKCQALYVPKRDPPRRLAREKPGEKLGRSAQTYKHLASPRPGHNVSPRARSKNKRCEWFPPVSGVQEFRTVPEVSPLNLIK